MSIAVISSIIVVGAFIVSILVHAVTVAYWAGRLNTSVGTLNEVLKEHKGMFEKIWVKHDNLDRRVLRLELTADKNGGEAV